MLERTETLQPDGDPKRDASPGEVCCESCQHCEIRKWDTACIYGRPRRCFPFDYAGDCSDYVHDPRTPAEKFAAYMADTHMFVAFGLAVSDIAKSKVVVRRIEPLHSPKN